MERGVSQDDEKTKPDGEPICAPGLAAGSPGLVSATVSGGPPKAAKLYNPQAVETVGGTIAALNRIPAKRPGRPDRVTMVLQTNQGTVKVLLGPADYLDRQTLKLAPGDQVEVRGIRIVRAKVNAFIAGEVRRGDQVLKLRDDATGRPLWAKGRARNFT